MHIFHTHILSYKKPIQRHYRSNLHKYIETNNITNEIVQNQTCYIEIPNKNIKSVNKVSKSS